MELTMTNQPSESRPLRRGGHWVFATVSMPLTLLVLGAAVLQGRRRHGCVIRPGTHSLCSAPVWTATATFAFWTLVLAFTVIGLFVGLADGRAGDASLMAGGTA
jgi:hypothetical protein